jgi:GntR family transcriptional repressor for pyruvate dehydrogenase complex
MNALVRLSEMRDPVPVDSGSPFKALSNRRAFEQIIVQIEDAILDGRLTPGDRLPSERELADTFDVSRASVREALRVLEMFGVVVARRGSGPDAGSVVAASAESGIHSALRLHTGLLRIPTKDVVDVRALLESQAAYQAADHAQSEELERLRGTIRAMEAASTIQEYHELDTEFHVELARASGNALLPVLMEALRAVMRRDMVEAFAALRDWSAERDRLVAQHQGIVEFVEKRDSEGAAQAVREHVVGFYRHVVEPGRPPAG